MSAFDRAHMILFVFNRNYVSILYHFRDTAGYLLKFANFDLPHLHLALPLGVTPFDFKKIFRIEKLESLGYRAVLFACSYV